MSRDDLLDGDVITQRDQIQLAGIDVRKHPRFEYRSLRYLAHRSLYRFQAEHWDLKELSQSTI